MSRRHVLATAGLLLAAAPLGGCVGVLYGLEGAAAVATIARDVIGLDTTVTQSDPTRTPIAAAVKKAVP